jgi:AcrR family transcriptional regulator
MKIVNAKETILMTAARLFHKQGYSNTGINQIIDEAGVAKSTLYHHFRSKEDLLIAYLEEAGMMTIAAMKKAALKGSTPEEKITAIFDYIGNEAIQPDFYGCHFLNIVYEMPDGDEKARLQIKKQKDAVRRLLAALILPLDHPELADEIYTVFEGALIGHKVHQDSWPIAAAQNVVAKMFNIFCNLVKTE